MDMVRHLLDVVGLDVNTPDRKPDMVKSIWHFGTPICYLARMTDDESNNRELLWLLLDRGADLTPF